MVFGRRALRLAGGLARRSCRAAERGGSGGQARPLNVTVVLCLWLAAGAAAAEKPPLAKPAPEKAAAGPASSSDDLQRLVQQLGNKDYFLRQQAEQRLAKLGFEAFDVLGEAAESEDLEIAARARRLLALLRIQWADKNDPPAVKLALREYELQNADGRRAQMTVLAGLPGAAGVPALCRLVRYEKSPLLAKHAAILLLGGARLERGALSSPDALAAVAPKKDVAERIEANLAGCRRPAAAWLLTWARSAKDPNVMGEPWGRLVAAEQALWQASPGQSGTEILSTLRCIEIAWLGKLGRTEELPAAVGHLIELQKGNSETLGSLLEWLVREKQWKAADRLAQQLAAQIEQDPLLLYALAEVRAAQGDTAAAERLAERALALPPGKEPEDLRRHLVAALRLQSRGRAAWARREYRAVIAGGSPTADRTLQAQWLLAEMLHDQGQDQEAGEVLGQLVQAVGVNRPAQALVLHTTLGEIRGWMHYFSACGWAAKGDRVRQREALDRALAEDPSNVEVLIACYRLSDASPAYHAKIRKLAAAAAAELNQKINEDSDDHSNSMSYNQFAWLVGNTEGDLDEALRAASRAVELAPEAGGYYDTLARVYFAKGDLVHAVKQQTKAAELEPHSGQIARQLAQFRKALEESRAKH